MDSDVRVRELASRSAVVRSAAGSTPVIETVPATGGMGRAYGLMLRWCRIVANHPTRCTTSSGLQAASAASASRSEEHTSELQSPYDLVCRLLLEKKKTQC